MVRGRALMFALMVAPFCAHAENDYPTMERVNYVMDCMDRHGGAKPETLTGCSCEIDKVAETMTYEHFVDANVYMQNKDTPGDKGGVFRDMKIGKDGFKELSDAREAAEKVCFVTVREVKRKEEPAQAAAEEVKTDAAVRGESSP